MTNGESKSDETQATIPPVVPVNPDIALPPLPFPPSNSDISSTVIRQNGVGPPVMVVVNETPSPQK